MGKIKKKAVMKNQIKRRFCYTKESVPMAMAEINEGKSIAEVARKYGVPETTLRAKKKGLYANKPPGPPTVLSAQEEQELSSWIIQYCDRGFPVGKAQLIESVRLICENDERTTPFKDNLPGRAWFEGFIKRHPQISQQISESVSMRRAKMSENSLSIWFKEVSQYLDSKKLLDVEPNRIFNSDEISVPFNTKLSSVLAPKGCKNMYNVVGNNEKENIKVLITGNAAGILAPPFILFAGKSLPQKAAAMAPKDYHLGISDNGQMTANIFYKYMANSFEPWLTAQKIKRPIIFYIDGYSSHLTLHLSRFCSNHGIILVALHPNATHVIQPLDVSFFKAFKLKWEKMYKEFCATSLNDGIKKYQFAPLLQKTLDLMNTKSILKNGFAKCGLYPLRVNAIDYKKVLHTNDSTNGTCNSENANDDTLKTLESLLSISQLNSFKANTSPTWKGLEADKNLFQIWYSLSHSEKQVADSSTLNVQIPSIESEYQINDELMENNYQHDCLQVIESSVNDSNGTDTDVMNS